jgi:hypothetical protein
MISTDFQDALDGVPVVDYPVRNDFDRPSLLRRILMRVTFLCFAVLFIVPHVDAAPAPAPVRAAMEKLEALKKKLPDIVSSWAKERWYASETVEVRVVRMLGPSQAKVVLLSRASDGKRGPFPQNDIVFTIFLDFYDGTWSATRFDGSWPAKSDLENGSVRFLMLAIDEGAEKKKVSP